MDGNAAFHDDSHLSVIDLPQDFEQIAFLLVYLHLPGVRARLFFIAHMTHFHLQDEKTRPVGFGQKRVYRNLYNAASSGEAVGFSLRI